MTDHIDTWRAIVDADDLPAAFEAHFQPLALTDECKDILKDIAQHVRGARIADDELVFTIWQNDHKEEGELTCSAPCNGDTSALPDAAADVLKLHNGMSFPDDDGWATNLNPWSGGDFGTGWDSDYAGEVEQDEALMLEGDAYSELWVPIDNFSDWWVYHPNFETKTGEMGLSFFSHESCEFETPLSLEFGLGGFFLRLLGQAVLGDEDERCDDYVS